MTRLRTKKGISLITLVITIIVVIILAAAVILGLQNNNPIDSATKAKFLNDVSSFKDELEMYKQGEIIKDTKFNPTNLNTDDATNPSTYEVIPSLQGSSYKNSEGVCDFYVEKGKLVYRGTNSKYQDWAKDAKIEVDKGQVHVAINAMQIKPVKQGTEVKYSVALTSTSKITDVDTSKIKVIDSGESEVTATITADVSEGDTSKTVTVTINTDSLADGEYNIKVEAGFASNEAGVANDEAISTDSFVIDSTAPEQVTEFNINPTGYTNGNVTLTMTKPVGAEKIEYSEDGGSSYTEYSGPITITENKTIYVHAIDAAGNIGAINTIAITNIDRTMPSAATINASVSNKKISATITLTDDRANGIDVSRSKYIISTVATAYPTDDAVWNGANSFTTNPQTVEQTEEVAGDYYIQVLSVDTAGNKAVTTSEKITVATPANVPVLTGGMTPIKWNGSTLATTNTSDLDWYNYEEHKWANAQTADGSMWVWIPRYEYKITSGYHTSTAGTIDVKFIPVTQTTADSGYIIHPAFNFGGTELSGIWVAKFEATAREGVSNSTAGDNVTSKHVKVVPNVASWRYNYVSTAYTVCRNMETDSIYGWSSSGIDTHLIKNIEWGAVAYLSRSTKYGIADGTEVWINPNSSYITGQAGSSTSASYTTSTDAYNTGNGPMASTTHNVYGVYDMSGGSWEFVAAYVANGNGNLTTYGVNLVNAEVKYKDVYIVGSNDDRETNYNANSNKVGDAVYETSANGSLSISSWFDDYSDIPCSNVPFFGRSGGFNDSTNAGLFYFDGSGGGDSSLYGFRPVLICGSAL